MQVVLGRSMEGWNGHNAGEQVGLAEGMRESLARGYIMSGDAKFVEAEFGETEPTKKELQAYNRALRKDDSQTKGTDGPRRRVVKRRAVTAAGEPRKG